MFICIDSKLNLAVVRAKESDLRSKKVTLKSIANCHIGDFYSRQGSSVAEMILLESLTEKLSDSQWERLVFVAQPVSNLNEIQF